MQQPKTFFIDGIGKFVDHKKCVEKLGDYTEK
jgi:hypothetical protein